MLSFIQRKTLLRKSNAWIMRLESYDISPVKMDNVLGEGMEMVYKLIHTRTTPVSRLTRRTDTVAENNVEKFAKRFLAGLPTTSTGKRNRIGMKLIYMTLMCACAIVGKPD